MESRKQIQQETDLPGRDGVSKDVFESRWWSHFGGNWMCRDLKC